ncbi:MAG: alanine:cation symporter family protein [Cytophagales bacterium]|jgi:AGCS family alanine or glycine:cation symporter|nr:alanine:cation symporter family protein [Cytophagales bacterium]MCA6367362.1 alanine:cation symporter family protein [Cytophagales bacterium]MCA6371719.1 alanine:cation symporter family protein [Cytophagales bacterium]MCA6376153.1 alanine:cation symporter family protein [Cytophagales bacterium]MCA6383973.1 alanine:cation symporter family protein [Cytophagales bacterium]
MNELISDIATGIWTPILFLLILGGLFFFIYSRFIHYKYFFHSIAILKGKFHNPNDPGQISPYEALSTALASTVGMGNIAGVAAAISIGGPGALFWMWVTAFVGMSTNFFTSTLSVMYRGKDSNGVIQGGPMFVIREALGKPFYPLAVLFCLCAMIGCLPIFQANQLTQAIVDIGIDSPEMKSASFSLAGIEVNIAKFIIGIVLTIISGIVIIGGIQRIGVWAGKMVPLMIVIYFFSVLAILLINFDKVPHYFALIITDAFAATNYHGSPALGGMLGGLIVTGVRRASFSNEAGIGTAPMALGASQSSEPIREGLVSMLSPAIDTLLVCSLTALAILVTGVWDVEGTRGLGVTLTANAFNAAMPGIGKYLLLLCAFFFAITSLFSYSYYGNKALSFLVGVKAARYYDYFYLGTIIFGAIVSMNLVINIIDIAYALMAIPTMVSGFILAPKVLVEARSYFKRMKAEGNL